MKKEKETRSKNSSIMGMLLMVSIAWGIIYIVGQQILRQGANQPQIDMAKQAVADLESGKPIETIMPSGGMMNMENDDRPFLMVFDKKGVIAASNVSLNNRIPQPPEGVFSYASKLGINKITWQPAPGIRNAIVVKPIKDNGWVLAGRSLKQTEVNEDRWLEMAILGWFLTLGIGGLIVRRAK